MMPYIAEIKVDCSILFPENYVDVCAVNLSTLPPDKYAAVIEDKMRWAAVARLLKQPRHVARGTLDGIADERLREDIRRRLNTMKRPR